MMREIFQAVAGLMVCLILPCSTGLSAAPTQPARFTLLSVGQPAEDYSPQ